MFEVLVRGTGPGCLKPETTKALIDGAVKIIGAELRAMPACLPSMSGVQRALLKLHLCEAIGKLDAADNAEFYRLRTAKVSLEPVGGSGMPDQRCGAVVRS